MPANDAALAQELWNLFAEPTPPQRERYQQAAAAGLLGPDPIRLFSPFADEHAARAEQVSQEFEQAAGAAADPNDALRAVIDQYRALQGREHPDLLYYALEVFLLDHPDRFAYVLPSILVRDPEVVVPTNADPALRLGVAVGSPQEARLDWLREDPLLNEHHAHWHVVYNRQRFKDRQGEMFLYMHQQMLARYDAERIAIGLAPVQALNDMQAQRLAVGYANGPDVRWAQRPGRTRNANAQVHPDTAATQVQLRRQVEADIDGGHFDPPGGAVSLGQEVAALNRLGSTVESNVQADGTRNYLNYHGHGHLAIGELEAKVILATDTAIRDTAFWEWHKGVDDLGFRLQERLPAADLGAGAPPVELRKSVDAAGQPYSPDLILCLNRDIPGFDRPGFDGQAWGQQAFGGARWDEDFAERTWQEGGAAARTTQVLRTRMGQGTIQLPPRPGGPASYPYEFLQHEGFCYFLRLHNASLQALQVTIRLFMAPADLAEDRRKWIELDKFLAELAPQSRTVVFRRDTEASVIRKPAVTDPARHNLRFDPVNIPTAGSNCDCGWPYHLLLPRGQAGAGMPFVLLAMVTDAAVDLVAQEPDCGSLSFCGARTGAYPDRRPLGYPFTRPFRGPGNAIQNAVARHDHLASRTIRILHE